jgi:hypothetical protein
MENFVSSLYELGDGAYGFSAMGIKNAIVSGAHKDKGIPRAAVMRALWLDALMYRQRPGLAGAICDMPLLRVLHRPWEEVSAIEARAAILVMALPILTTSSRISGLAP